ncbi:MAG: 3-methyl-2-oxobutanoate dehydrogenase subunit VorB [Myxococcales bacterium]|nr:MAG: 3-methyl-2-oxobutanoate dehydrogenase subunit VorB [Myxococcales bacterium]
MAKKLMKGAEAIGEAAIWAGCRAYFCYPITPQTEVAEYLSRRMPQVNGAFLQAESELAAANMIFGASGTGARVFTTSSSPGISLMSEAISYIAAAELPAVFVNIIRSGPGLGGILPAQSDYFQATKGGGHGDYRLIVLAPATVQEAVDMMMTAFDLADEYRNPVMLIGDGLIGQMMEPVEFPENWKPKTVDKSAWVTEGAKGRTPHIIKTLFLDAAKCDAHNHHLAEKYRRVVEKEQRWEDWNLDGKYEVLLVSFGTMSRICKTVIEDMAAEGIKVGLVRPKSLYPFPSEAIYRAANKPHVKAVLSVEMNMGQMVEDVERAVRFTKPVSWYGRAGGVIPTPEEVAAQIRKLAGRT